MAIDPAALASPATESRTIDDLLFEIEKLPQWRTRWNRRLNESRFDTGTWQPVMLAELEKVKRGGTPYSDVEAVQALKALQGQGAPVAEPTGFLGTARRDLATVVKSLGPWHLIPALVKEPLKTIAAAQGEPISALDRSTFSQVLKALAPGHQLQTPPGVTEPTGLMKAANFPGARFVPGFGTAARVLAGPEGWKEIKEHPVFTALDIAPYGVKLVAPALGSALRQVTVPDWLSVKVQSSPYMLMRGVELPGSVSNMGRSMLLDAVMGAGRTGRPLTEVLQGLGHTAEFGPRLSWGSFLERMRSYPGRRFGFGPEEQAISRLYVQTQRRFLKTFQEIYTGTKPEGVRKLLGVQGKTPALRAATELMGKWDDPAWVKGAYDHLSGINMLDELENAINVWRETGKFNLDPKPIPDQLAEFKNYIESAYDDPHIPLYDPASGKVAQHLSLNDIATEFSGELRRTYDLDLPSEWGAPPLASQAADGVILSPDKRAGGAWDRLLVAVHRVQGKQPGTAGYEKAVALVRDRVGQFNKAFTAEAPSAYRELARAYVEKRTGLPLENWMDEAEWIKKTWMDDQMQTTPGLDWDAARQRWEAVRNELLDEATPEGAQWAETYRAKFGAQAEALRDVNASWTFLWDSGIRPTWLHQVHYGSEFAAGRIPALLPERVASASAWMADSTRIAREYYKDYRLGMTHYAMETLRYLHGMENIVQLEQAFARPQIEVFQQLLDFHKGDTRLAQIAYDKTYREWRPSSAYTFRRARVGNRLAEKGEAFTAADKAAMEQMAIPVSVMQTLEKLSPRGRPLNLPASYDKAMDLWRMSILGLRPSWNVNNVIGGMIMLTARTGPGVFKEFRQALDMVRQDTMPNAISQSRIVELLTDVSPAGEAARTQFAFGRTMGRLWTTLREPFHFNEFVDNLYRSMAYLQGSKKGLAKGLSKEAATEQGVRLANKVLQDWDALTPIEQQIFRNIWPFYGWCLDKESECLTRRGWLKGDELSETDEILSCTPDGRLRWSAVKSIYRGYFTGQMHQLKNNHIDALVTPGHKFLTTKGELVPVEDLKQNDGLRLIGSSVEDTLETFGDAFVELVGWSVTDAYYKKNASGNVTTIEICQKDGRDTCDQIRGVLKRAGAQWHEFLAGVDRKIRYFGVTGDAAQQVLAVAPGRVLTPEFVVSLSVYQRRLLYDTMMAADGYYVTSRGKGDPPGFKKAEPTADSFQMLVTLLGNLSNKTPDRNVFRVTVKATNVTKFRNTNHERVDYGGPVWCPETEDGAFVARRNGKVYVTGNSKHITRYVMSYPWDHPLRASFLGNLAKVVVNGADPTLSDRFNFGILKFGELSGKVVGFPVAALNPFQDINRTMSLAGFISYLNPALQVTLESMGVDPRDARQEAFPELVYDVEGGRLVAARPGFGQAIISLFPQVEALGTWAQLTESSRELWKDNPEAARAQVIQRFGLPVPRQYSLSEERIKEAVARHRALRGALAEAMKGRPEQLAGYVGGRGQAERLAQTGKAISAQTQGKITYDQILLLLQLNRASAQGYGLQ